MPAKSDEWINEMSVTPVVSMFRQNSKCGRFFAPADFLGCIFDKDRYFYQVDADELTSQLSTADYHLGMEQTMITTY